MIAASPSPEASLFSRIGRWLWPLLLLLGCIAVAFMWLVMALTISRQAGWMAILAAVDAAWILRFCSMPRGKLRIAMAILGTMLVIVVTNWSIAAVQIGGQFGLYPWEALLRMGPGFAWNLSMLANTPLDLFWQALALVIAWYVAR
ncbi:MAG: hypothetical protein LBL59_03035 [Xanthomonadaceae bacterium]|jgi:hypothetical protein|nr:hypothetical protein [Xanthomonadaceae bacterium]